MRYMKTHQVKKVCCGNLGKRFLSDQRQDVQGKEKGMYLILEGRYKVSFVSVDNENWASCGPVNFLFDSGLSLSDISQLLLKAGWKENPNA